MHLEECLKMYVIKMFIRNKRKHKDLMEKITKNCQWRVSLFVKKSSYLVQLVKIQSLTQDEHCFPSLFLFPRWCLSFRKGQCMLPRHAGYKWGVCFLYWSLCLSFLQGEVWSVCASWSHLPLNPSGWCNGEPRLCFQGLSDTSDFRCPWVWFTLGPLDSPHWNLQTHYYFSCGALGTFPT